MSEEYGGRSGYTTEIHHPLFDTHPRLAPIVAFSRSATLARAGGLCGDSTDRVLAELGYSDREITGLHDRKIVG
jgi:crotonobetainyl-CoA:carnitine CoA-transferase CaiB-like acyl-CoA transferase